jgi:allophanate hydrolase
MNATKPDADWSAHARAQWEQLRANADRRVWIRVASDDHFNAQLATLEQRRLSGDTLPLLGQTFALKDNIDAVGFPTTAGCPDYAYQPAEAAPVVARLKAAGAILFGKTTLDQFATGLTGTRSPHGPCPNSFHPEYISGGSSSGSAVKGFLCEPLALQGAPDISRFGGWRAYLSSDSVHIK